MLRRAETDQQGVYSGIQRVDIALANELRRQVIDAHGRLLSSRETEVPHEVIGKYDSCFFLV